MHHIALRDWLRYSAWFFGGITVLVAFVLAWHYVRALDGSHVPDSSRGNVEPAPWPEPERITAQAWSALQRGGGQAESATGPLATRFRLAGTFFAFPEPGQPMDQASRRAILDDLREQKQHLLQEGDSIADVHVVGIFQDRMVLRSGGREETLWLSFHSRDTEDKPELRQTGAAEATALRFEDMPALETNRFGKRIGENRWLLDRMALMDYYQEVMEDPERLTAALMAMQPVPDEDEDTGIGGFVLDMMGENELYEATGMQNGDVVRMVNSMPMVSGARAAYFIKEFVNERLSAVVLDIEREGQAEKLIYLIR